jgi:hypothetical protein
VGRNSAGRASLVSECTGGRPIAPRHYNPHVILTTGCNDWQSGLDIVVESDADGVTAPDRLERLVEAWATSWLGMVAPPARRGCLSAADWWGQALPFAVAPKKVLAFGKGTLSRTRRRFTEPAGHRRPESGHVRALGRLALSRGAGDRRGACRAG